MPEHPLVSVIIPMYNVAEYIAAAIHSVRRQTYPNWEIIAVDDGSPDHSSQIVASFADPRIRIVRQPNGGLSAARNTGIRHASGTLIALLDADDMWQPEKLACHVEHFRQHPQLGLSYSGSRFMNASGQLMTNRQTPKIEHIQPADIFLNNPIGNGSAPVIRLQTLQDIRRRNGEYFCESLRQSEDVELWLRIALMTSWQIAGIRQHLTLYRINENGLSANMDAQFDAWLRAVENNRRVAPQFIDQWFATAAGFQCRYLARRAVQCGSRRDALRQLRQAFHYGGWQLLRDTRKTVGTVLGTISITLLPRVVSNRLTLLAGQLAL